jgi:hypothetical protein
MPSVGQTLAVVYGRVVAVFRAAVRDRVLSSPVRGHPSPLYPDGISR